MTASIKHSEYKETTVAGRYVTGDYIQAFLDNLDASFHLKNMGKSVQGRPIYSCTLGTGKLKILMWSQMHGNESTTTKAVLDLLNYFKKESKEASDILEKCTITIIPILNPDGAFAYTRINANRVDLNRDAQELSQPESQILHGLFKAINPDFCFNLHGQRTIFNVGVTEKPATISFLAPAFNEERSLSSARERSMQVVAAMNTLLQRIIPNQMGRYDDGFNANCVGDAFQMTDTPTILFEAGHYYDDYDRERTREFMFLAILEGVRTIANQELGNYTVADYLAIPENGKLYYDILINNAQTLNPLFSSTSRVGVLYEEVLKLDTIVFKPKIFKEHTKADVVFGHVIKDLENADDASWLKKLGITDLIKEYSNT